MNRIRLKLRAKGVKHFLSGYGDLERKHIKPWIEVYMPYMPRLGEYIELSMKTWNTLIDNYTKIYKDPDFAKDICDYPDSAPFIFSSVYEVRYIEVENEWIACITISNEGHEDFHRKSDLFRIEGSFEDTLIKAGLATKEQFNIP